MASVMTGEPPTGDDGRKPSNVAAKCSNAFGILWLEIYLPLVQAACIPPVLSNFLHCTSA